MERYLTKKSEKIASALYLVTSVIKDDDSIKWKIREEAMSFISTALLFKATSPLEKDRALESFSASSETLISFLNICMISGLISRMNSTIIIHELELLMEFLSKNIPKEVHSAGYILSDSFFATDVQPTLSNSQVATDKGHKNHSRTDDMNKNKALMIKDKKNSRQENIIGLLKKDSNLTIKDFTKVIKDCSEKTIQRELILLVEKGVIKRVGERRWSTYSLV
ncbi:MAG: hypothetical protein QG640_217 [Patescibacteria group bacterium]|nr:hypothetical protein [Patescibacteria group bacterium]